MATALQFGKRPKKPVDIDPDLKGFIDRVIVPILVKEYLEMSEVESVLAKEDSGEANFVSSTAAPAPGPRDVRP
jgi:hypothetical protein